MSAQRDLFETLQAEPDIAIGGDTYRISALEMRIKYRASVKHGWKLLEKFESLEAMALYWAGLKDPRGPRPGKPLCDVLAADQAAAPNPWDCGNGRGAYCDAESREHFVRGCADAARLQACLAWPDTQQSVQSRIRAKLRRLAASGGPGVIVREVVTADQVLAPERCRHADAEGRCANPDDNCQGTFCHRCMAFEAAAQSAPAEDAARAAGGTPAVVLKCDGACVALDEHADPQAMRVILGDGWRRAQGGLAEILRFGAMLLAVGEWLDKLENLQQRLSSSGHGGDRRSGTGLKAWLETNCPEINYKTAHGYLSAAAGLRREARLAADVPLLALMGEDPVPDARAERLRRRVQRVIEGSTLGLLKEAARGPEPGAKGGAREGAGRPRLEPSAETRAGAAWGLIGREIDRADGWGFAAFLPEAMAREALHTVTRLRDALKARVAEFGGKGAGDVE